MTPDSRRFLGVLLSGALFAGWVAGSLLKPPVATTQAQVVAARSAPPAGTLPARARVMWPVADRQVPRPSLARNPFTFRSAPPVTTTVRLSPESGASPAESATGASMADADAAAGPRWRLSGVAISADGEVVAVISGGGDVHLARPGDVLPGGAAVLEVGPTHVVVQTVAGPVTLRLP